MSIGPITGAASSAASQPATTPAPAAKPTLPVSASAYVDNLVLQDVFPPVTTTSQPSTAGILETTNPLATAAAYQQQLLVEGLFVQSPPAPIVNGIFIYTAPPGTIH